MSDAPYQFVTDPAAGRVDTNLDSMMDVVEHGPEQHNYNDTVGGDVTEAPRSNLSVFSVEPRRAYTRREPRVPIVGTCNTFTVNVYGDGQPRALLSKNINRKQVQFYTDAGNTAPIYITCLNGRIALAPGCLPIRMESYLPFTVSATTSGTLYVIEEQYHEDYVPHGGR